MDPIDSERQRAGMLIDAGRPRDALGILSPMLASRPDDALTLRLIAMAQAKSGRHRESLDAATAATRLRPADDLAWRLVASAASVLGLHDVAADAADRACALGPGGWRNHYIRVLVAANAHSPSTQSGDSLREMLRLAPAEPEAHFAAAQYAGAGGDWPAAEQGYRTVLELAPNHALAQNNLAAALLRQKKLTAATTGLTHSLGTDPTLDIARENLFLAGRAILFRLCLIAALTAILVWGFGLGEIDAPAGTVVFIRGLQIVLAAGLAVAALVQFGLLRRSLGTRTRTVIRQFVTERAIRVAAVLFVVTLGLIVAGPLVPSRPEMSASGPAILVAILGAVASRAL